MNEENQNDPKIDCRFCQKSAWWATLVIAVLAVPSFGFIVAASVSKSGLGQVIVFVVSCWLCTWLGMKAMQRINAKQAEVQRKKH